MSTVLRLVLEHVQQRVAEHANGRSIHDSILS